MLDARLPYYTRLIAAILWYRGQRTITLVDRRQSCEKEESVNSPLGMAWPEPKVSSGCITSVYLANLPAGTSVEWMSPFERDRSRLEVQSTPSGRNMRRGPHAGLNDLHLDLGD